MPHPPKILKSTGLIETVGKFQSTMFPVSTCAIFQRRQASSSVFSHFAGSCSRHRNTWSTTSGTGNWTRENSFTHFSGLALETALLSEAGEEFEAAQGLSRSRDTVATLEHATGLIRFTPPWFEIARSFLKHFPLPTRSVSPPIQVRNTATATTRDDHTTSRCMSVVHSPSPP
ncbi:hypothetical protein EDD15DRAFT_1933449 [Pisolithus albus]|nr:hypothetical protein EDD15DRAFT_1933449 [Pisolithus albus]